MKKVCLLALCSIFVACSQDMDNVIQNVDEVDMVKWIVPELQKGNGMDTRSSIVADGDKYAFSWAVKDTVGIFPNQGTPVAFPMTSGEDTGSANFDGGGWALKSGATYKAYYPYAYYRLDPSCILLSYEGQKQTGNNSTAHLGKYDYLATNAVSSVNGEASFKFAHIGSFFKLVLTLPNADNLNKITLSNNETAFPTVAKLDISESEWEASASQTGSLSLDLENVSVAANGVLTAYLFFLPTVMENETIHVEVEGTDNIYEGTFTACAFTNGKYYTFDVAMAPKHEYVDLGLSVKWAATNLDARTPEETGGFYAFGEMTSDKTDYSWSTYQYYEDKNNSNTWNGGEVTDWNTLEISGTQYDTATQLWGSQWRMPTKTEIEELVKNCTITYETQNEVAGFRCTGKNGNSIFFPATGYKYNTTCSMPTTRTCLWSSTILTDTGDYPLADSYVLWLDFSNNAVTKISTVLGRYQGLQIRPVRVE